MSSIAFTIRPSPVLLESLPEDDGVALDADGVAAFLGFGPSIVCVLNCAENKSINIANGIMFGGMLIHLLSCKTREITRK